MTNLPLLLLSLHSLMHGPHTSASSSTSSSITGKPSSSTGPYGPIPSISSAYLSNFEAFCTHAASNLPISALLLQRLNQAPPPLSALPGAPISLL